MSSKNELVNRIVKLLDDKKARDIQVLDIHELTTITDYFIIATGNSTTQVKALCDHVEEELHKQRIYHTNKEGYHTASWILLGYQDVVVHLFLGETREFYKLDHVWQDAEIVDISDIISGEE